MADYAWPGYPVAQVSLQLVPNVRSFTSPYTGAQQTVDLLGERWKWNLSLIGASRVIGAQRQAFFNALRGASKTVAMGDLVNPVPTGTLRGTPTLNSAAAQGATSLSIACTTGQTLLIGDKIGVGGMLFEAAANATSVSGVMALTITSRVRVAQSSAAAVTWNAPTVNAVLTGNNAPAQMFDPDEAQPLILELTETW